MNEWMDDPNLLPSSNAQYYYYQALNKEGNKDFQHKKQVRK